MEKDDVIAKGLQALWQSLRSGLLRYARNDSIYEQPKPNSSKHVHLARDPHVSILGTKQVLPTVVIPDQVRDDNGGRLGCYC